MFGYPGKLFFFFFFFVPDSKNPEKLKGIIADLKLMNDTDLNNIASVINSIVKK